MKNENDAKIIVGPRICNYSGIIEYSRRKINFLGFSNIDTRKTDKIYRTMITSGCAFLIKKEYYEKLKGFDDSYFMYKEDIDFSIRASMIGIKHYVDNSIHFYHLRSDKDYKLNNFKYYYHERNRLIMCLEHSTKKNKMLIAQFLLEPFHLPFSLMKGFFKERLKVYKFIIQKLSKLMRRSKKENVLFDRYFEMDGIFNEINTNSLLFRILNFYVRTLYYIYRH